MKFYKIQYFSFTKMHLKISSTKWRPFCPGGDVLKCSNPSLIAIVRIPHRPKIAITFIVHVLIVIDNFHNLIACGNKIHIPRDVNRFILLPKLLQKVEKSFKYDLDVALLLHFVKYIWWRWHLWFNSIIVVSRCLNAGAQCAGVSKYCN